MWNEALASPGRQLSLNANFGKTSLLNHYSWYDIHLVYVNISILFSVKFFSLCGRGDGRHNPFAWFYNNYHCFYTSQVLSTSFSRQGESCVGDITAPPTSKKPTTIRQQTTLAATTTTPKRRLWNKSLIRKWFMTANRPAFLHVVHSFCHYQWAR